MRILFCGGGTAGHVYPNIAIAETFRRNLPNVKMAYVVTPNGIENELVQLKKYVVDVVGLKKVFSLKNIEFCKKMIAATRECKKIINEFRPNIIIGTGGYATYPVVLAGYKLGVKTVLHESNLLPGKTIKSLEKRADRIFINFDESSVYFKEKEKLVRTGNPIRQRYYTLNKEEARQLLGISEKHVILCFGGSLGAEKINNAAIEVVDNFVKHREDAMLIWATGKRDYDRVKLKLQEMGLWKNKNLRVFDYIDNMPEILSASDIVVCRAGAVTISEVALCGKCTVFIPSPNVANNHQFENAKMLFDKNAAVMLRENEIFRLTDEIKELIENTQKRKILEKNIRSFALPDANKLIFEEILHIL